MDRIDGPVWSAVQDDIDHWELGFSDLTQNNLAFAFPILVLKSDEGAEIDREVTIRESDFEKILEKLHIANNELTERAIGRSLRYELFGGGENE